MSLLDNIKDYKDLANLSQDELANLSSDLREKIISVTLKNGGHLASSLGAVELTVALLRVFDPEQDKIIFDVGHQCYAYKILTGRKEAFDTLRTKDGIAGFPRMNESKFDFFTVGHSSTSISAALGYAIARDIKKQKHEVVAVVGDGALLNGVSFEALNNIDNAKTKVIIVLNDNNMSISPRVGGFAKHLAALSTSDFYMRFKKFVKEHCRSNENGEILGDRLKNIKHRLKSLITPRITNAFDEIGISYWGPFDGHNLSEAEEIFRMAREYEGPLLIHFMTKKGKGLTAAEENPSLFHGVSASSTVESIMQGKEDKSWTASVAEQITAMASHDERIVALTAAMKDSLKLNDFEEKFAKRFFDVGIAEEHMFTFAAGLSAANLLPVAFIYSTFLQRAVDGVIHDIALQNLPVLIMIDRAGLVGEDGETHQGVFDLPLLLPIPNLVVASPRDGADLELMLDDWHKAPCPMAIRYPRANCVQEIAPLAQGEKGKSARSAEILQRGEKCLLIGFGSTAELMLSASDGLQKIFGKHATVLDLRYAKPLDTETLKQEISRHELVVTAEESCLAGGVGEKIAKFMAENNLEAKVVSLGVADKFVRHATRADQWNEAGLTVEHIVEICRGQYLG